ncbi:hypothetical protein PybrP1_007769 [[Pythium] brassicae (nom. inval.)]|nr:hypothetical protein PybrP1_007769 [[Pythium] brassicae (nom. inval.)]
MSTLSRSLAPLEGGAFTPPPREEAPSASGRAPGASNAAALAPSISPNANANASASAKRARRSEIERQSRQRRQVRNATLRLTGSIDCATHWLLAVPRDVT